MSKKEHKGLIAESEAALPATPQTLVSDRNMDSDDEVNSFGSGSEDGFGEDQDSSVDFGAGTISPSRPAACRVGLHSH